MGIGWIFLQVTVMLGQLFMFVIGELIVCLGCGLIYTGKFVAGSACVLRPVWWHKLCPSTSTVIVFWHFPFSCIDYIEFWKKSK
jgi:hypothetical protein